MIALDSPSVLRLTRNTANARRQGDLLPLALKLIHEGISVSAAGVALAALRTCWADSL